MKKKVTSRGTEYIKNYSGFNIFFYGHKLKWQTGIQHTIMADSAHDGWGVTTGLRLS